MLPEAGHLCIPVVLSILNEVVGSYVPEENWQDAEEAPAAVALGVVANIFQKVIEIMALRLKKEPEEGKKVRIVDTWKLDGWMDRCTPAVKSLDTPCEFNVLSFILMSVDI